MIKIYPSLIAAPTARTLSDYVKELDPHCTGFHLDIMDDIFVPNTGLTIDQVNTVDAATKHPSWVHLMVQKPLSWIAQLKLKSDSIVSFHIESKEEITIIAKRIKENNWKPSLAINPKTAIAQSYPSLHLIDQILIMSVEPGYSGQHFLPSALSKIAPLLEQRKKENLHFTIALDGGINQKNIRSIIAAQIDAVAIGSGIFESPDPVEALKEIKNRCR